MKKRLLWTLVSIVVTAGMFCGIIFSNNDRPLSNSNEIEHGLLSYAIAAQYGYGGTIRNWVDSLEKQSAYKTAVENGYSGTETDWQKSLKAMSKNMVEIKDVTVTSDGELELVLSDNTHLNMGAALGQYEKNDVEGISVAEASLNDKKQMVVTFSDGKKVNLDCIAGLGNENGVGVAHSKINNSNELVLTYTNGQQANLGPVVSSQTVEFPMAFAANSPTELLSEPVNYGDVDGSGEVTASDALMVLQYATKKLAAFPVGDFAPAGVASADINDAGELVLTYLDGNTANLGRVVGYDGEDGAPGKDGIGVVNAEITSSGELVLTYSNGQRSNLGPVIGADGVDGTDGQNGKDGVSVSKSEINVKGELILTYSDGVIENLGPVVGAVGKDGAPGQDGKDGIGIQKIVLNEKNELVITLTNKSTVNLGCIQGEDGKDGAPGKDGEKGKDGVGVVNATINDAKELVLTLSDNTTKNLGVIVGEDGVGIKKTEINALGELVITYSNGKTDNLGVIVSDNGGVGTSAQAPRIRINENTNEWEISVDGGKSFVSTGVKATGQDGVSIADATVNEDNELVLTFSDNTVKNIGVVVGKDGEDGAPGKDGVGVSGAKIDGNDHLILILSNSNTIDVGVVVGKDGVGIQNVTVGADGVLTITLDNQTVLNLGNIKGEDGIGITKSEINAEGKLVLTYSDGQVVTLGKVVGNDGVGISSMELTSNYMLKITFTNGQTQTIGPIRGEKGETGAPGKNGEDGAPGKDGEDGEDGAPGKDGVSVVGSYIDDNYHLWLELSDGTKIDAGYVGVDVPNTPNTPTAFTVTFKDYNGTVLKTESVESGKAATAPINPTRDGYTFAGWDKTFSNITADTVVTATYTKITKPTLTVGNVTSSAGTTNVEVVVNALNNPGIAGMTLSIEYDDTALTLTKVSNADALSGLTYQKPKTYENGCNLVWYGAEPDEIVDGNAFKLVFSISSSAKAGTYPIKLVYSSGYDVNLGSIDMAVVNGSIVIK